jgi:hypothetical protein
MNMITCRCSVCQLEYSISEQAHPAYRSYCPNHWLNMLEDHDREAIE